MGQKGLPLHRPYESLINQYMGGEEPKRKQEIGKRGIFPKSLQNQIHNSGISPGRQGAAVLRESGDSSVRNPCHLWRAGEYNFRKDWQVGRAGWGGGTW